MQMKRIGILTFFQADNYGALLQCFALREFCIEQNNEVKVIDYHSKQMFTWKHKIKKKFFKSPQNRKFDRNRKKFFKIGKLNEKYDVLIVGSDQVWNPEIIKGDKFWIEPEMCYKKLISYAASLGKGILNENEKNFLKNCDFSKYDLISVREKSGQDILCKLGVDSEVVCDPTLLFYNEPDIYNGIVEKSELDYSDYIFVYSLEKSDSIDLLSQKLAAEYKSKVISVHPANSRTQVCDEFVKDSDICDFLYLIKNAKVVVTNSFHGLAFSYIFRKEIYCICHTTLGSRQKDLIETSGINFECLQPDQYHISNYSNDEKLKEYVRQSKVLINEQIR